MLPWSQNHEKTAFVFCDVLGRDYKPFEGDPRWVLRRQLDRARAMGLDMYVGPELEYFYFKERPRPEVIDEGGYFDVLPADLGNDLRKQTMRTLDRLDIPMEASHHEVAPSQHEIDPHYDEALIMADRVMICRLIVKEVAAHNGVHATFMPKPLHGENGSGMHVHQSLFRGRPTPSSRRTTRTTSPSSPRASSPVSSSTWARSARCSTSTSTASSAWCRATRRRSTSPGRTATAPP